MTSKNMILANKPDEGVHRHVAVADAHHCKHGSEMGAAARRTPDKCLVIVKEHPENWSLTSAHKLLYLFFPTRHEDALRCGLCL